MRPLDSVHRPGWDPTAYLVPANSTRTASGAIIVALYGFYGTRENCDLISEGAEGSPRNVPLLDLRAPTPVSVNDFTYTLFRYSFIHITTETTVKNLGTVSY